jgi:D-alanyl-D-alanine carboxypeptidase (penicillin-binding protein 5/6)
MPDLSTLIRTIEKRRKTREYVQFGFAAIALGIILGGGALFAEHISHPTAVASAPTPASNAYDKVKLSGKAAIVYDLTTGEVLYAKNAEAQLPLASLTKLLTLYAASKALADASPVVITGKAAAVDSASGLKVGDTFAFKDAARLAVVASSNDAAEAIAEAATSAADAPNGTALLANAASSIGLTQTYALNGTGLDENTSISGGYGSAKDIAVLAGALLARIPDIMHATIESQVSATAWNGNSYTLENTNPEVSHIPGLMMSKTGYTDLAGGNLAVVFDAGVGHPVAVVVLGSTRDSRFSDVDQLVKATSERFAGLTLP